MSPAKHASISDKTNVTLSVATWCAIIGSVAYFTLLAVGIYNGICKRLDSKMDMETHSLWVSEARKRTKLDLPYDSEIIWRRNHSDTE